MFKLKLWFFLSVDFRDRNEAFHEIMWWKPGWLKVFSMHVISFYFVDILTPKMYKNSLVISYNLYGYLFENVET